MMLRRFITLLMFGASALINFNLIRSECSMEFPFKVVDLTHTITPQASTWDGGCGFKSLIKTDYKDFTTATRFRVQHFSLYANVGTHMDAPAHCVENGVCIADLKVEDLVAPCVVLDVSKKAHERFSLSVKDIEEFEEVYGEIPPGSIVIVYTGWDRFWTAPDSYRNNYIFPSISPEAAQFLLKRSIKGVGIDTFSPDRPAEDYPVHELLLGAGKYIIENIANAQSLPPLGSYVIAMPIKVEGGTEAPIRLIGLIFKR